MLVALEEARANDEVARKIYELRKKADLSQRQLAKLVGTTASVICLLEDADYQGHSLSMLRRIASAPPLSGNSLRARQASPSGRIILS